MGTVSPVSLEKVAATGEDIPLPCDFFLRHRFPLCPVCFHEERGQGPVCANVSGPRNRKPGQGTAEGGEVELGKQVSVQRWGVSFAFVFLTSWAEREALIATVLISEIRTSSGSSGEAVIFLALEVMSDWHPPWLAGNIRL